MGAGYDVHLVATAKPSLPYIDHGITIHPLTEPVNRMQRLARRTTVARSAIRLKPDLLHVHEPELLGPVLAHAGSCPVIWDVHESYLDVLMSRHWIPKWLRPIARSAWDARESQLVKRCAGVAAATERIAERYRSIHNRVEVIANYPELVGEVRFPSRQATKPVCLFTGTIAPNRGISQVLFSLSLLKARSVSVTLELAGRPISEDYLRNLWSEADRLGIRDHVRYHGYLSKSQTIALQQRGGIGMVTHLPGGNNEAAWPVKMFEFMAAGLPLIYSNLPTHQEIAGPIGAGIPVDPHQPEQIANAIEHMLRNHNVAQRMGEAGIRAVRSRFNWKLECVKLLKLYRDILSSADLGHRKTTQTGGLSRLV